MRSRPVRVIFGVAAWIALGAAAVFLYQTEQSIADRRAALHAFDLRARDAVDRLGDLRAAQQAYVAAGQGVDTWLPKVDELSRRVAESTDFLRAQAAAPESRSTLMGAAATITEFNNIDRRAREYLEADQQIMAADVVFAEGGANAASAASAIESARQLEYQFIRDAESSQRQLQAYAAGGAAGFAALVLLAVALIPSPAAQSDPFAVPAAESAAAKATRVTQPAAGTGRATHGDGLVDDPAVTTSKPRKQREAARSELNLRDDWHKPAADSAAASAAAVAASAMVTAAATGRNELLLRAADLCTELGRLNDAADLPALLARAAEVMDASGLVVWVGDETSDLRPVLAHGYTPQALARMPSVPRSANNAAATAFRSGKLQIVLARPGVSNGAVVAPLLSASGCVGALTAEIKPGCETSDGVQAVAAIVASQLANVVAASATPAADLAQPKSASA